MRWLIGVLLVGAGASAPGCTRDNPSFADEDTEDAGKSPTSGDTSAPTGGETTADPSASTTGPTTGTPTSSTTGPDTDSGFPSTGSSGGMGYDACPPSDTKLRPAVFDTEGNTQLFPLDHVDIYAGDLVSFSDGTLELQVCGGCVCPAAAPLFRFELGASPDFVEPIDAQPCLTVAMIADEGLFAYQGFAVFPPDGLGGPPLFAGFDGLSLPDFATSVLDIEVDLGDDRACGVPTDDCGEPLIPGQYALRFADSEPVFPGDVSMPRNFGGRQVVFRNRKAQYGIDGLCGPEFSWTMEREG